MGDWVVSNAWYAVTGADISEVDTKSSNLVFYKDWIRISKWLGERKRVIR